jgi:hypothetical protein
VRGGAEGAAHPAAVVGFGLPIQDMKDAQQVVELVGGESSGSWKEVAAQTGMG